LASAFLVIGIAARNLWWQTQPLISLFLVANSLGILYVTIVPGQPNVAKQVASQPVQTELTAPPAEEPAGKSKSASGKAIGAPWYYFSCCTARPLGHEALEPEATQTQLKKAASAKTSPKFCGLRVEDPTIDSMDGLLGPFEARPLGPRGAPPEWEPLLRCSEAERAAMRELRARLQADVVEGPKDSVTMLRFIRARPASVQAAAEMYAKVSAWKIQIPLERGFRERTIDDSLHRLFDSHWPPTGLLGHDLEGDPIYWIRLGHCNLPNMVQMPEDFLVQHEVYSLARISQAFEEDSVRQRRPIYNMTVVLDVGEATRQLLNPSFGVKYRRCVRIAEDYYPEMIKRVVVVRAPGFAAIAWRTISRFFDEGTQAKFQFVDSRNTYDALVRIMDSKWIPEALGGSNRLGRNEWCAPVIAEGGGPPLNVVRQIERNYRMAVDIRF
jgi:hypothetical protein